MWHKAGNHKYIKYKLFKISDNKKIDVISSNIYRMKIIKIMHFIFVHVLYK